MPGVDQPNVQIVATAAHLLANIANREFKNMTNRERHYVASTVFSMNRNF
jgi:hypothetical protein